MSRSMVLVFLLLILIITSQLEWKQQLGNEIEATPIISNRQQQQEQHSSSSSSDRQEAIKEKIILSQERNIQRLNELVRNLEQQLQQCTTNNNSLIIQSQHLSQDSIHEPELGSTSD